MMITLVAALTFGIPGGLSVCDRAPALVYGAVLKGRPVHSFSHSRPTVVEFWATWCGPCIQIMPHLSELYSKYKDRVDFVGVSVRENDVSKLPGFVKDMGEKMAYPVVADKVDAKGQGFMNSNWLDAAKQDGIPVAFIVDRDEKIAWIGYPSRMDDILKKVVDGTWDARAYRTRFEAGVKDNDATALLLKDGYDKIMTTSWTHKYAETLTWIEQNRAKYDGPTAQGALDEFKKLFTALKSSDYDAALKLAGTEPTNGLEWTYFRPMLLLVRIDALQSLKREEWRDLITQTVEKNGDPNVLGCIVDALTLPGSKLPEKDPKLAIKAAEVLTKMARVPMFLVRLAWAYHADGQTEKAKATLAEAFQKMDVEKRRNPQFYKEMLANLNEAKIFFEKK